MAKLEFGQKPTVAGRAAVVEALLGRTTGASKGVAPLPKPKIKPKISKDTIGATVKWKF